MFKYAILASILCACNAITEPTIGCVVSGRLTDLTAEFSCDESAPTMAFNLILYSGTEANPTPAASTVATVACGSRFDWRWYSAEPLVGLTATVGTPGQVVQCDLKIVP
jgi:hypothetical protein